MFNYHLTYIWLDADQILRQKVRILEQETTLNLNDVPIWNFDGSSTGQATRKNSEVLLVPCRLYRLPETNKTYDLFYVLSECCVATENGINVPHPTNHRYNAQTIFNKIKDSDTFENYFKPWFGIEQEFFIIDPKTNLPVDYNPSEKQGKYYCASDSNLNDMVDMMMLCSREIGINVVGYNTEVAPGQAELQLLGQGLKACDDLIIMRYIIIQIAKKYGYQISFHPKVLKGDWNGSGAHVNYSTLQMRDPTHGNTNGLTDSYAHIMYAISKFDENHQKHIAVYGEDNELRLTGKHETSDINTFTYGIANRGCSIRIPNMTHHQRYGYIEDRRPSSNFNPYLVLPLIFETSVEDL
jgi:glutamine synthetase